MTRQLGSCVNFLPPPDDVAFLRTAHDIFIKHNKVPDALAVAIRLGDPELIEKDFRCPANPYVMELTSATCIFADIIACSQMRRQLAFLLARAHIPLEWIQPQSADDDPEDLPEDLIECLSNTQLSLHFREYGKELGVVEPKSLEDIYKSHLENVRESSLYFVSCNAFQ